MFCLVQVCELGGGTWWCGACVAACGLMWPWAASAQHREDERGCTWWVSAALLRFSFKLSTSITATELLSTIRLRAPLPHHLWYAHYRGVIHTRIFFFMWHVSRVEADRVSEAWIRTLEKVEQGLVCVSESNFLNDWFNLCQIPSYLPPFLLTFPGQHHISVFTSGLTLPIICMWDTVTHMSINGEVIQW